VKVAERRLGRALELGTLVCARRKTVGADASAAGSSKEAVNAPLRDGVVVATAAARAMPPQLVAARTTTGRGGLARGLVTIPVRRMVRAEAVIAVVYMRRANFSGWLRVLPSTAT
jgi:hypothetical protein